MKFHGVIGYVDGSVETGPGIFKPKVVEKPCYGEFVKNNRNFETTEYQNDDLVVKNTVSILSSMYMRQNYMSIKYIRINGANLKVTSVTLDYPRIRLELGGFYTGPIGGDEDGKDLS